MNDDLAQVERGAVGVCCQTLVEAEAMVHGAGISDILLTNQVSTISKKGTLITSMPIKTILSHRIMLPTCSSHLLLLRKPYIEMQYWFFFLNSLFTFKLIGKKKLRRFAALAKLATTAICVDSIENVNEVSEVAMEMGAIIGVLVEVNVGQDR